jgi:hypothetical protein
VAAGDVRYPAVGRLIFASCPERSYGPVRIILIHRGPVLSLGSGVLRASRMSHNDVEGWPPHPIRFTSWLISMSCHFGFVGVCSGDKRRRRRAASV